MGLRRVSPRSQKQIEELVREPDRYGQTQRTGQEIQLLFERWRDGEIEQIHQKGRCQHEQGDAIQNGQERTPGGTVRAAELSAADVSRRIHREKQSGQRQGKHGSGCGARRRSHHGPYHAADNQGEPTRYAESG